MSNCVWSGSCRGAGNSRVEVMYHQVPFLYKPPQAVYWTLSGNLGWSSGSDRQWKLSL